MSDCDHDFSGGYRCRDCGVTRMDIAHRKARQKEDRRVAFNAPRIAE